MKKSVEVHSTCQMPDDTPNSRISILHLDKNDSAGSVDISIDNKY